MQRLNITLAHEIEVMRHQLYRNGVRVIEGTARFRDVHSIEVDFRGGHSSALLGAKNPDRRR